MNQVINQNIRHILRFFLLFNLPGKGRSSHLSGTAGTGRSSRNWGRSADEIRADNSKTVRKAGDDHNINPTSLVDDSS